jgi:hypothetical protein
MCILWVTFLASGQQSQPEPDAGKVIGNTFESAFFKFHYSFPQSWSAVSDDLRMSDNRKHHERAVEEHRARQAASPTATDIPAQPIWEFDLLTATPGPLAPGANPGLPRIYVLARERFGPLREAGDHAKLFRMASEEIHKSKHVVISGQTFVRSDFRFAASRFRVETFESLFETAHGKYLVEFDFLARSEKEMKELAKTMESLRYE